MSIQVGDKVTIIVAGARPGLSTFFKYVTRVDADGGFVVDWTTTDGLTSGMNEHLSGEGVAWVRGHRSVSDPAVRAALAAATLLREDAVPVYRTLDELQWIEFE